jgi:SAM-dependent methyltransferase
MDVTERLGLEAVSEHTLIASEHLHRYEFAARLCDGKRVVDLCCGTGYGSAVLAVPAASVVGVDNDVATIETAMRAVGEHHGVAFVAADATAYLRAREPDDLDMLVCFEGIEHVSDVPALAEQLRRLADGGVALVISVPNSQTWDEDNPYHVTAFSYDTARELFDTIGIDVRPVQNVAEGSVIADPDSEEARDPAAVLQWPERIEAEYANHFLGTANIAPDAVRAALSGRLGISYAPTYNRHIRNIERANAELWRTNARLARSTLMRSGSAAAAHSKREAREFDERAAEIARLVGRIRELEFENAERDKVLQRYIREAQRRANRPARKVAQVVVRTAVWGASRRRQG